MTSQFPTRQIARLGGHNGVVHAVTYSAGSSQYVCAFVNEPLKSEFSTLHNNARNLSKLNLSHDTQILTGSTDHAIRLFNPSRAASPSAIVEPSSPTPGLVQTYDAHGYEVLDLAVSADNARFISVGGDKTVFLWDVSRAVTVKRWSGHAGKVNACTFGGTEGSVVVSGSYDGTVRLWDAKSQSYKPIMVLSEARDSVSSVAVVGAEIITGSVDGRVRSYDIRMGQMAVDVIGAPVTSLAPTKNTDSLLVSSLDSTVRLMDKVDGKLLKAYKAPEYKNADYRIRSTLGLSDSVVLSGSESGHIFVWDLLSGSVLHKLRHCPTPSPFQSQAIAKPNPKKDVVSAVTFCTTRKEWASAGGDGNVIVWGMPA